MSRALALELAWCCIVDAELSKDDVAPVAMVANCFSGKQHVARVAFRLQSVLQQFIYKLIKSRRGKQALRDESSPDRKWF